MDLREAHIRLEFELSKVFLNGLELVFQRVDNLCPTLLLLRIQVSRKSRFVALKRKFGLCCFTELLNLRHTLLHVANNALEPLNLFGMLTYGLLVVGKLELKLVEHTHVLFLCQGQLVAQLLQLARHRCQFSLQLLIVCDKLAELCPINF